MTTTRKQNKLEEAQKSQKQDEESAMMTDEEKNLKVVPACCGIVVSICFCIQCIGCGADASPDAARGSDVDRHDSQTDASQAPAGDSAKRLPSRRL